MKIAYITAGAGGMYCGSCLRDNALAMGLMDAGHDVLLIPLYTPTRTDERNVSLPRVFLGGINVFLQQQFEFFRKSPRILHRLLDLTPLLRLTTRWGISVDPARLGALTVSMLEGTGGHLRQGMMELVDFLADEVSPDIINIPNALLISLAPAIKARMKVPICCTLQGENIFLDGLGESYRKESLRIIREHAAHVDVFTAVSRFGARHAVDYYGIDASRIHVVPLGINFAGFEKRGSVDSQPFTIGYLARVAPEKGLHVLCEAYQRLKSHRSFSSSRLWAAGYLGSEHKSYLAGIRKRIDSYGLSGRFKYHGELDRQGKLDYLKSLSLFSVPGPADDPKGLFLLEALASGVPVVQPRCGAFTEIVETTGGGILVEPDNPDDLAAGIADLWDNPGKRQELGSRGYESVRTHYSAESMAQRALEIYRTLLEPAKWSPIGSREDE